MKIEPLYFSDCPSWRIGLENLTTALQIEGIDASVVLVKVEEHNDATRWKFLGSPTFQIDGQDLWPDNRDTYSLSCRVYSTPDGIRGYPSVEILCSKLTTMKGNS